VRIHPFGIRGMSAFISVFTQIAPQKGGSNAVMNPFFCRASGPACRMSDGIRETLARGNRAGRPTHGNLEKLCVKLIFSRTLRGSILGSRVLRRHFRANCPEGVSGLNSSDRRECSARTIGRLSLQSRGANCSPRRGEAVLW